MLKVQLNRDLRKNILRGQPWVYREAVELKKGVESSVLCQVLDRKGQGLAWALYSPEGPLALRILSTEKRPPNETLYQARLKAAWNLRASLRTVDTNAYRLVNGEGDWLPGFVCDVYNNLAVMQFDGDSCYEFWDQEFLAQWLLENTPVESVYCKPRRSDQRDPLVFGASLDFEPIEILENGVRFIVDYVQGQKTGFFLDQRDNRQYLKSLAQGKTVLNLFSYTGGFSIYAGLGGADRVTSVDLSEPALQLATKAWHLNDLEPGKHKAVATDVFDFLEANRDDFDVVMVDPPSMTHSEKTKAQAVKAYTHLFSQAARLCGGGSHLVLSSCSSHISFQDFFEIIEESLSKARKKGQILKVSGQGIDHPFPHSCRELRYLKFVDVLIAD